MEPLRAYPSHRSREHALFLAIGTWNSGQPGVGVIVYQAASRDPLELAGVVLAMSLLGLVATWIPAQRALSIDPLILSREE